MQSDIRPFPACIKHLLSIWQDPDSEVEFEYVSAPREYLPASDAAPLKDEPLTDTEAEPASQPLRDEEDSADAAVGLGSPADGLGSSTAGLGAPSGFVSAGTVSSEAAEDEHEDPPSTSGLGLGASAGLGSMAGLGASTAGEHLAIVPASLKAIRTLQMRNARSHLNRTVQSARSGQY